MFTVKHSGGLAGTFTISCGGSSLISCTSISATQVFLNPDDSAFVTAYFSASTTTGSGKIRLFALAPDEVEQDSGWYNVTVSASAPTVTIVVPVLASGISSTVSNRQPLILATFKPNGGVAIDTTRTVIKWRSAAVTTLARANRTMLEWQVDSIHRLGVGDSALVEVDVCATGSTSCAMAIRRAVLPNDNKPVLGFTGVPLEALGRHFMAPFGPGFSVNGGEVEAAILVPPYFSMGRPHSAGLVYSTRQSYPRALIPVDLEVTWPAGTPDTIQLTLIDNTVRMDSVKLASPTCATGSARTCRIVLDADFSASTFSTPTRKWMKVEARVRSGATVQTNTDSVEVVLVDRRTTMYGSGWWPAGFLKLVGAGSDRVLVDPSGSASVFRGNGDSLYLSPPGDFSTLVKVGSGWELRARSSPAKVVFDANGRLQASVDANGNRDSIGYVLATDEITAVVDPVGQRIAFSQTGAGKFSFFTDPGSRQSKVVINDTTNQLTYDSISSAPSRPYTTQFVYQTYTGWQTVALRKQTGVINDSTVVKYDSTFKRRPVQVTLSPVDTGGGTASPVISYTAYEQQGYHSLRSLDSVYVQVKDPRGNWTRSLLNRWGEARTTWDSLGVLARAQFTAEGFVQWAEGKVADSSRIYNTYDPLGQLARTYIIRATGDTLRTDSLVYDANHRVIKQIDSRGKATVIAYDGNGNVLYTVTPHGDTTKVWYRTDGLPDSTRAPGDTFSTRFTYDATWKVGVRTRTSGNQLVDSLVVDHFGRDSIAMNIIRVQVGTGSSKWQWHRRLPFYSVANQLDSTRIERTDNCTTDPCPTPPPWPAASDTIKTQRVAYRFDRAGRDSLRLNDRGATTGGGSTPGKGVLYLYDVLGRVRSRHPWSDSTFVVDSFVYDIAGNLKKTITRRGDVITVNYDSRNRDTLSVIPGVGTLRKSFAGPLDQLTRMWLDTPVDSIHDVNAEVRFGYDQRGRLKGDTSYASALAQSTTHTYDTYERPATITDRIGTWTTRYETDRGMPDTLLTPLADTVTYTYDTKGRAVGPTIKANGVNGGELDRIPSWGVDGVLSSLSNTVPGGSGYNAGLWLHYDAYDDQNPPMVTEWTGLKGFGGSPDTTADSLVFDGWERLTTVKRYFSKHNLWFTAESYGYDRTGNIKTSANETYDILSDKLTSTNTCTYRYDRAGNDTSRTCGANVWTYQYDALNQLRSARYNGTLIVRYGYDVLGRRIAKRVYSSSTGGTVGYTRFVYHSDVAYETDSAATTVTLKYVRGSTDDLLAIDDGTAHYYVVQDKLRSVRGLVRRDGAWIRTLRYFGYGAIDYDTSSTSAPSWDLRYQWTGRELDKETGLYFFRSRYYDPGVRGFIQEDPAEYVAGSNLYAYGNGSPLNGRDPSGMMYNSDPYDCKMGGCPTGGPPSMGDGSGGGGCELLSACDPFGQETDAQFADLTWTAHQYGITTYQTDYCGGDASCMLLASAQNVAERAQKVASEAMDIGETSVGPIQVVSAEGMVSAIGVTVTVATPEGGLTFTAGSYRVCCNGMEGAFLSIGTAVGIDASIGLSFISSPSMRAFTGPGSGSCIGGGSPVGLSHCFSHNEFGTSSIWEVGVGASKYSGYSFDVHTYASQPAPCDWTGCNSPWPR